MYGGDISATLIEITNLEYWYAISDLSNVILIWTHLKACLGNSINTLNIFPNRWKKYNLYKTGVINHQWSTWPLLQSEQQGRFVSFCLIVKIVDEWTTVRWTDSCEHSDLIATGRPGTVSWQSGSKTIKYFKTRFFYRNSMKYICKECQTRKITILLPSLMINFPCMTVHNLHIENWLFYHFKTYYFCNIL